MAFKGGLRGFGRGGNRVDYHANAEQKTMGRNEKKGGGGKKGGLAKNAGSC